MLESNNKKVYVAFKNMLHNEFKISNEDLKNELDLAVKSKVTEIVSRKLQELDLDELIKKSMEKGTEPQFSNNIYTIENIRGKTITLDNGDKKRRKDLLLVPHDTIDNNVKNIIRKATRDYKIEQTLKRDGINKDNILIDKRERKKL